MTKGSSVNSGEPMYSRRECPDKEPKGGKEGQDIMHRQSDYPTVSKKSRNGDGEKGIAVKRWGVRDTPARHRTGVQVLTKLATLTSRARGNRKYGFMTLAYLLTEDFLKVCFWELKRDKASGIDGVSVKDYEGNLEENLKGLERRLKAKRYRPRPVRRVYIPKGDGGKRPLGIPTVEDKVVQMGIKKILEAIFEPNFIDGVSYGFRPRRNAHEALDELGRTIVNRPVNYVVDMDIEKFFDTIDHKWLMKCLRQRVKDSSLLRLIGRFLRTGIMEEGKVIQPEAGTPQGGVISPILANIYLHYILDLWFEKVAKKQFKGYARLIRYADDFVVCFQNGSEAKAFGEMLKERLGKFGLRISEKKSRIIEFGRYVWQRARKEGRKVETFDFLGFTYYCAKARKGSFKVVRHTARDRFGVKAKGINDWLKKVRNAAELKEWWPVLRQKLIGHYRYYGIKGNYEAIEKFYNIARRYAYKWLNRRSQRRSFNWEQYTKFLRLHPLPRPRILRTQLAFKLATALGGITEEPYAGNPHVRFCEGH